MGFIKAEDFRVRPTFIIYTPSFDEMSGGSIVLHKLCYMINQLGYVALLWPMTSTRSGWIKNFFNRKKSNFSVSKFYPSAIAQQSDLLSSAIVVYPEVVSGNPLKHKNIVRWFLHKPGYHTGTINFGEGELYFFYDQHSDDPAINSEQTNKLSVAALNPVYKNLNQSRSGTCYLVRKGKGKTLVHDTRNSIKIDGLSHAEVARIFNSSEFFYSYDEMTFYSQYAALCGCVSVVVPESYATREEWVSNHPIGRYGVAYGEADIPHALETAHLLEEHFAEQEEISLIEVQRFIDKSINFFSLS